MRSMTSFTLALLLPCCTIAIVPTSACAQESASETMPAWDQLTPAQQAMLTAPVRERWNDSPNERARLYQRAQRWHEMTPEQRQRAQHGVKRWRQMGPQQRTQARALFRKMRDLPPDQRKALREQWKAMTPAQREAWVKRQEP